MWRVAGSPPEADREPCRAHEVKEEIRIQKPALSEAVVWLSRRVRIQESVHPERVPSCPVGTSRWGVSGQNLAKAYAPVVVFFRFSFLWSAEYPKA